MASEVYTNYAQTTLSVAALSTDTTLSVVSVSGWPTTGNFHLRIDDPAPLTTFEYMLVTSVNVGANQVTGTRGQEGTTAIAHSVGAFCGNELTSAALTTGFARLDNAASQTFTGPLVLPYMVAAPTTSATSYGSMPVKLDDILVGTDSRYLVATAQITFLNTSNSGTNLLPTGFRHLLVEWYARGDTAATTTTIKMFFNNDAAANYDVQHLSGSAAATAAAEVLGATNMHMTSITAATATANYFAQGSARIHHYTGAVGNKLVTAEGGWMTANTTGTATRQLMWGKWRTAATPVTRVDIVPGAGNFIIGSVFTLWGIP